MGDVCPGEQADKARKAVPQIEGEQLALPVKAGQQRLKGAALIGGKGALVQSSYAEKIRMRRADGQGRSGVHACVFSSQKALQVQKRAFGAALLRNAALLDSVFIVQQKIIGRAQPRLVKAARLLLRAPHRKGGIPSSCA